MIKNILWKGLATESLEYCSIYYNDGVSVRSSIVGHQEGLPFKMDYEITLDRSWVMKSVEIRSSFCNMDQKIVLKHDGYGKWYNELKEWKNLEGCTDIDISLSPFTNTLPVNRLQLSIGETRETTVVYIDLPEFKITKARQLYSRISKHIYRFTNDSGDFTADIRMDDEGLVVHYPILFDRVLIRE